MPGSGNDGVKTPAVLAVDKNRIVSVYLDEKIVCSRRPEVEHERRVAIYDLIEDNTFRVSGAGNEGPYSLHLFVEGEKLYFDVRTEGDVPIETFFLSLKGFRAVIREYFMVCDSYYGAIRTAAPSRIEAVDAGRRSLHNEGASMLRQQLSDAGIDIDLDTARRLFTLVCVLHARS